MTLALIIAANVISGVMAVWLAMALVWLGERWRAVLVARLVDLAIGTLLATALLGLLPAALRASHPAAHESILGTTLLGIFGFIALERLVAWRHCHVAGCPRHDAGARNSGSRVSVPLVLIGDGLHNFIDGVVIASAFGSGPQTGVAASLAVLMHELPQEMGDFGVLLKAGLTPRRALLYNTLGAMTAIVGGITAYFALDAVSAARPYVLAISAASFVYLALADLVPSLHDARVTGRSTALQLLVIAIGVASVVASKRLIAH